MLEARIEVERDGFSLEASLEVADGVTALVGPSGSGKTTFLEAVAGLVPLRRGRLVLDGRVLEDVGGGVRLPPEKRGIAFVFQDLRLFPHMSVRDNLLFGSSRSGPEGPSFEQVVEILELGRFLDRPPRSLSGGQARRVALGRGLLSRPGLILLDEPLAGLDRELAGKVLPYLVRVRESLRVPALYVTHDPGEALALADRAVVLREGRIVREGPSAEVLHDPEVFPLARATGVENVLRGVVERSTREETAVRVGEIVLHAPASELAAGAAVLLGIRSRDLVVSREPMVGSSMRNRLAAEVEEVHPLGDRVLVYARTRVGSAGAAGSPGTESAGARLVVEVTLEAARELGLAAGVPVELAVKSAAVQILEGEGP